MTPSEPAYWDEFYEEGAQASVNSETWGVSSHLPGKGKQTYEWYLEAQDTVPLMAKFFAPNSRVLQIGCGNSLLAELLLDEAPPGVHCHNIDICETAIDMMKQRQKEKNEQNTNKARTPQRRKNGDVVGKAKGDATPVLTYEVMDACNMTLEDEIYDIVFEKGTIDAFLSTFQDETGESAPLLAMLGEVQRVLKAGGVYLALSGNASFLVSPYLQSEELDWEVECIPVEKKRSNRGDVFSTYYLYVMRKPPATVTP